MAMRIGVSKKQCKRYLKKLGFRPYRDGHVPLLTEKHKRERVKFATEMSRIIHEKGRDHAFDDVWHSDEKIYTLEWNDHGG